MNNYIQEITDHIKRIIAPEEAIKITDTVKEPRTALLKVLNELYRAYRDIWSCVHSQYREEDLRNTATRLSLYAAALAFELHTEPPHH
jgi:hypothetical protein